GHGHDLALVRRVRQDFLVAGHRRVEADLAARGGWRAKTVTAENRAVFEGQNCFHELLAGTDWDADPRTSPRTVWAASSRQTTLPATIVAMALPLWRQPRNGVLAALLAICRRSATHSRSGSKTVTSASAPRLNVPLCRRSSRPGATVNFAIRSDNWSR